MPSPLASNTQPTPAPISHYENFPVASWLCPPRLRAPIAAIYHFARTADDLADEGTSDATERLGALDAYEQELLACAQGGQPGERWSHVFAPLAWAMRAHALPLAPLTDLLSAFRQDVLMTRDGLTYPDRAALLDYCRRSANPVGRLLLHLYGVGDEAALRQSDAICSALQLINFWQDLSVDLPRGRHYLTDADCTAHGVARADLVAQRRSPASDALLLDCAAWAHGLMLQGAPLVHRLPWRIGWELRLVVQGGLAVLAQVQRMRGASLLKRPRLRAWHLPGMFARAAAM